MDTVLMGYVQGAFPMADSDTGDIHWYSPDPRAILELDRLHLSRTLRQTIRSGRFTATINRDFDAVIRACADRSETWINDDIRDVYTELYRQGFAHSVETWVGDTLAGGLYGVAIGGAFFGESMFHRITDGSKVALAALVHRLVGQGFTLLDVQFTTPHLVRLGVHEIPRALYLKRLEQAIQRPCRFALPGGEEIPLDLFCASADR
jgi:leucyl/phenylalanyl-tRNA--protein transferase